MIPGAKLSYDLEINDRNGKTKAAILPGLYFKLLCLLCLSLRLRLRDCMARQFGSRWKPPVTPAFRGRAVVAAAAAKDWANGCN